MPSESELQEAEKRLEADLSAAGLSRNTSPLICQSFYQSLHSHHRSSSAPADAAPWEAFVARQLHACVDQLQRRGFLMRHCSAETRLALAACDWAAEKSQVSVTSQQMSGLSPRHPMSSWHPLLLLAHSVHQL